MPTGFSSSTATLYRHVANRAELIGLVFDRILGEAGLDKNELDRLPWDAACRDTATRMYEALTGHGRTAALLAETVPTGPNAMAAREHLMSVLTTAGFPTPIAARTVATLGHYVLGFAMQTQAANPSMPRRNSSPTSVKQTPLCSP